MYKKLMAPILVQWEITPICNHNCLHCYNYWRDDKNIEKLTDDYFSLSKIIVDELIKNRVFKVIITGGEPLMVINEMVEHIKNLSDHGISVLLNSNLTLLNYDNVNILKECGVKSILVSLPSADPDTCDLITGSKGSLERIKRGILIAKEAGFKIFTNMVVSRYNKDQITTTAKFVSSIGLKNFSITRASDPSSNREFSKYLLNVDEFRLMQQELNNIKKEFGLEINSLEANPVCSYGNIIPDQGYKFCCAGKTSCTIGYEGNIRPCNRSTMVYGNIREGLSNAWDKMDNWRSDVWIPDECSSCKLKKMCGGGCKADAFKTYGDMRKPDPLCDFSFINSINNQGPKLEELTNKDNFLVNEKITFREEKFGLLLCTAITSTLVSFELGNFVLTNSTFTLTDLQEILVTDKDTALATVSFLIRKKVCVGV